MNRYNCYCTPEQTKRAYKLGAPIETKITDIVYNDRYCTIDFDEHSEFNLLGKVPTAEQLRGWLREKGIHIQVMIYGHKSFYFALYKIGTFEDAERGYL